MRDQQPVQIVVFKRSLKAPLAAGVIHGKGV